MNIASKPDLYTGASEAMKVWGPMMLPTRYPAYDTPYVMTFLVYPAVLPWFMVMKTT